MPPHPKAKELRGSCSTGDVQGTSLILLAEGFHWAASAL